MQSQRPEELEVPPMAGSRIADDRERSRCPVIVCHIVCGGVKCI